MVKHAVEAYEVYYTACYCFQKYYWLILLGPLVAGLAALTWTFLQPPVYEAEAQLAIVKSGSIVNFDPRYKTVSEIDSTIIDQTARRKSLATLAKSEALASAVSDKIGAHLDSGERVSSNLLDQVNASIDGDLVRIKVRANDPQKAALIANTWSELYRDQVNQVYGEETLTASDLQAQVDAAKHDNDAKERAGRFLLNSPIDLLSRQINQKQQQLADLVTLENKLDRLLADATALKGKLASGTVADGRADELAALLLGASAFSTWSNLPVNLQIPIDQLSPGSTVSDQLRNLDTLIATLQDRRTLVQTEAKGSLQQELNALQAQLEQANAQKQALTRERDLSTSTLTTLANKASEVQIAAQSKASVVRLALAAVPPDKSILNRLPFILEAAFVGFILSFSTTAAIVYAKDMVTSANQPELGQGLGVIAAIPEFKRSHSNGAVNAHDSSLVFTDNPRSLASEAFRLLRYTLQVGSEIQARVSGCECPARRRSDICGRQPGRGCRRDWPSRHLGRR